MSLHIESDWIETEETIPVRNKYDGTVIEEVSKATPADVADAIAAAREATETMRKMPAHERADILEETAQLIEERTDEFAEVMAAEAGKPIGTARGEVGRAVSTFTFSAEEAKRLGGEEIPLDAQPGNGNRIAFTKRFPKGVIGAISPFNFPLNLVAHKLGPAFAGGNTVVLKPATTTPLTAIKLTETLFDAGLPRDALNLVIGSGSTVGQALLDSDDVDHYTFTGSRAVGKQVTANAGLASVSLELGNNSPVIVHEDADVEDAADRIIDGGFSYAGQMCISVQRVLVHEAVHDDLVDALVARVEDLTVGDPLEETTDVGPMIDEGDAERIEEWIANATEQGAELVVGGDRDGAVLEPTIVDGATQEMDVVCREAFAPVLAIQTYDDVDDAIQLANDTDYGLQAGIFTFDHRVGLKAATNIDCGGVMINDISTFRADHQPYGGSKASGIGREGPKYAVHEMTEERVIAFRPNEDLFL
ncbi:aldehyde dehydrogenase family protein [Natronosalvus caseinilyticus]|uniref:aldehyde dehydrogenase family protein n=1 Tax=Natronosalvus caseinilyticus TaxID=2953747 RepID=UPI0028B00006|nr:aldehyde dehydrogenase family protein [Natronosalvus caseinilyticus]